MGILIDTGAFIALQRTPKSIDFSGWAHLGESFVSVITISELLVGAWRADNELRKQERLVFAEFVLKHHTLIDVTLEIARLHSQIVASLQARGTPIGLHDIWIAATAKHFDLSVVTTNIRDFSRVEGLQVLDAR
jgi:tRNA(fMet)-specific endonuclease VapC